MINKNLFPLLALTGLIAGTALASPGAHGPNGEHLDSPAALKIDGLARLPDGSVQVPVAAQRRMGILTRFVPLTDAPAALQLPGRVVIDPNASGRVQTVQGGRIEPGPKGLPVAGQTVRKGEVLAYVRFHAEPFARANQQAQLSELASNRKLAAQRVERLRTLEGSVPRKEIEAAEAELASLTDRERDVGGSLQAREALLAPVDGVIASASALAGQVVEPRDVLFEVIAPSHVLVEASTADPSLVSRITGARLQDQAGVKLSLTGASRVMRDGVLPLTFRAQAERGGALPLAVGQPLAVIVTLNTQLKGYVVPAQAVVRNPANQAIVWIKSGAERYIPQPVDYRPLDSNSVVVIQGLGDSNRVVMQGASLIAQIR
ncbi:efflux RND transporter periplasmic adaptor subunit [Paucibacter sp. JuS9]|uniref:efflux RND transporter periplasmic adaptor subunit n=1 Tax=Roseateles TaxID=93681 RepID=UPI00375690E6